MAPSSDLSNEQAHAALRANVAAVSGFDEASPHPTKAKGCPTWVKVAAVSLAIIVFSAGAYLGGAHLQWLNAHVATPLYNSMKAHKTLWIAISSGVAGVGLIGIAVHHCRKRRKVRQAAAGAGEPTSPSPPIPSVQAAIAREASAADRLQNQYLAYLDYVEQLATIAPSVTAADGTTFADQVETIREAIDGISEHRLGEDVLESVVRTRYKNLRELPTHFPENSVLGLITFEEFQADESGHAEAIAHLVETQATWQTYRPFVGDGTHVPSDTLKNKYVLFTERAQAQARALEDNGTELLTTLERLMNVDERRMANNAELHAAFESIIFAVELHNAKHPDEAHKVESFSLFMGQHAVTAEHVTNYRAYRDYLSLALKFDPRLPEVVEPIFARSAITSSDEDEIQVDWSLDALDPLISLSRTHADLGVLSYDDYTALTIEEKHELTTVDDSLFSGRISNRKINGILNKLYRLRTFHKLPNPELTWSPAVHTLTRATTDAIQRRIRQLNTPQARSHFKRLKDEARRRREVREVFS